MPTPPKVMGILNVTPDSFSDGGQHPTLAAALQAAHKMIAQGADIIDIGGESTRPNAHPVSLPEELARVIPVIKALAKTTTTLSIDTSKPTVMTQAIQAGASMINDINALTTKDALQTAATLNVPIILMHKQGTPQNMQNNPTYKDVIDDIKHFFTQRITACLQAGIPESRLILDPGFGFGKTHTHNLTILRRFHEFKSLGLPLLAGLSRKSMLGKMLNTPAIDARQSASIAAALIAAQNGANILRVHDVRPTKDALTILTQLTQ